MSSGNELKRVESSRDNYEHRYSTLNYKIANAFRIHLYTNETEPNKLNRPNLSGIEFYSHKVDWLDRWNRELDSLISSTRFLRSRTENDAPYRVLPKRQEFKNEF